MRQIFWGKVSGQTVAIGALWAAAGIGSLLLYALASPVVGVGPALAAWLTGQLFVAALFLLGVGLGTALATFPKLQKTLKGFSTLLFFLVVGFGVYGQYQLIPADTPGGWGLMALRLFSGSLYGLVLAALLFWFTQRRLALLRRRDVAFGDGAE